MFVAETSRKHVVYQMLINHYQTTCVALLTMEISKLEGLWQHDKIELKKCKKQNDILKNEIYKMKKADSIVLDENKNLLSNTDKLKKHTKRLVDENADLKRIQKRNSFLTTEVDKLNSSKIELVAIHELLLAKRERELSTVQEKLAAEKRSMTSEKLCLEKSNRSLSEKVAQLTQQMINQRVPT